MKKEPNLGEWQARYFEYPMRPCKAEEVLLLRLRQAEHGGTAIPLLGVQREQEGQEGDGDRRFGGISG